MKIIFLDFDGVLNNEEWCTANKGKNLITSSIEWWSAAIDPSKVQLLNKLIEKTEAKVVVSSAQRMTKTVQQLRRILEYKGFKGEIVGKTRNSNSQGECRGDQILHWIRTATNLFGLSTNSFVILDDTNDMGILKGALVKTSSKVGLTSTSILKAQKIMEIEDNLENGVIWLPTPSEDKER